MVTNILKSRERKQSRYTEEYRKEIQLISSKKTDLERVGFDPRSLLLSSEAPVLFLHFLPPPELLDLRSSDAVHPGCHLLLPCRLAALGGG